MYSLSFPNMFSNQKTYLLSDHDATYSNLRLMLLSDKLGLMGDPYFGTNIKRMLQNQTKIIKDIIIDDIYKAIAIFMPQIKVVRKDINVYVKHNQVFVTLRCTNELDHTNNLYEISLTNSAEQY